MITQEIGSLLRRGVAEVIIEPELAKLLRVGKTAEAEAGFRPQLS